MDAAPLSMKPFPLNNAGLSSEKYEPAAIWHGKALIPPT
jgi:hypothetical protein